jgi:hypothetical protein
VVSEIHKPFLITKGLEGKELIDFASVLKDEAFGL